MLRPSSLPLALSLPLPLYLALVLCFLPFFSFPASAGTISVTTTADSGAGSLRQALLDANADPGADTVTFDLAGEPPYVVQPLSPLPTLTDPVVIDGSTQPGFATIPIIVLDGSSAGAGADGLRFETLLSTVKSLVVQNFSANGLFLGGPGGHEVMGCHIGTDAAGGVARANGLHGIYIDGNLQNKIGGPFSGQRNVISGNGGAGVYLANDTDGSGDSGTEIQGNYIGVDVSGTLKVGNGAVTKDSNIVIDSADDNIVGGSDPAQGNVISGSRGHFGITIRGTSEAPAIGNVVQNNLIGVDWTATQPLGNLLGGVRLTGISSSNFLIGNVISGQEVGAGVLIEEGSSSNALYRNHIGVSLAGTPPPGETGLLGNPRGVVIRNASGNTIGNFDPANRNIISDNFESGVIIENTTSLATGGGKNRIQFNTIGASIDGSIRAGNGHDGIRVIDSPGNLIYDNLISGNAVFGVSLSGASHGTEILRNTIGLDISGTSRISNRVSGIRIGLAAGNVIGRPGEGNIISGNGSLDAGTGLTLSEGANNNLVQGNRIGLPGGDVPDANLGEVGNGGPGIVLGSASGNLIGGSGVGEGNEIAFNGSSGIVLSFGSGNAFSENSIYSNGGLGIDLWPVGVNPNDSGDGDSGPNLQQNFPVLSSGINSTFYSKVEGALNSSPSSSFVVEVFASSACDDSGQGEGEVYLGAAAAHTNALGDAAFELMIPRTAAGPWLTATATDMLGNTSELSECLELVEGECPECIFFDGFESGETSAWSLVVEE
ncbi:MAG: right-handed parallel beta-helix repeat-containing protein [Deltaproteobacteria bacterium]|nr:right-handed parallel beta-helix repeat-containing protein [Deltaproteobacteria bacterium]